MLTLYTAPGTCALASHIALEQAGADYTTQLVDFKSTQQRSPEYLKLNPKGRVPALVTEHGVLTETPAILLYIAQRFRRHNSPRSTTRGHWRSSTPSAATSARRCTCRTHTAGAAPAGPTTPPRGNR